VWRPRRVDDRFTSSTVTRWPDSLALVSRTRGIGSPQLSIGAAFGSGGLCGTMRAWRPDCGLSPDPNLLTGKRNGARRRWRYAEERGKVVLEPSRGDQ
jgi:hypothetical protein